MRSVPPHIPYPSASLRERSYASAALLPLPSATTSPFPLIYIFSKFSFPCGSIRSLESAFIIGQFSKSKMILLKMYWTDNLRL